MSQDALGQLKHLKTARARWPFPDVERFSGWSLARIERCCSMPLELGNGAEDLEGMETPVVIDAIKHQRQTPQHVSPPAS